MYDLLYSSNDLRCAVVDRCFINIFVTAPKIHGLRSMAKAHREFLEKNPGDLLTLNVVSFQGARLDPRAQSEALTISREFAPHTLALAYLVETKGVLGSLQRGVVGTIGTLSRSPYPQRTFSTLEEASRWLAAHNEVTDAEHIVSAVNALRAV